MEVSHEHDIYLLFFDFRSRFTTHCGGYSAGPCPKQHGVNVRYHAVVMHGFFKGSPFNYDGMDYRMPAYLNEGPGINTGADGGRGDPL